MSAAVVLMAYGSPERLEDVPAYYADIRGGRPLRPDLLEDLVERYRRLGIRGGDPTDENGADGGAGLRPARAYEDVGDEEVSKEGARAGTTGSPTSSPLNAITEETRAALERELGLPVFTGMKHWTPRIAEAGERAVAAGAEVVVGLVLAPHYSGLSIGGYRSQLEDALSGRAALRFVESWHDEPGFVELLADRVRGTGAHVVFTAHSLPARILAEGDPYQQQLLVTSTAIARRAALSDWSFSYQSASETGEPWLGPDILEHLGDLHGKGVRDVLVCPVGFVADHLEIRWDLDTEAVDRAHALGLRFARIEMPNADPAFVRVLAGLVQRHLRVPLPT